MIQTTNALVKVPILDMVIRQQKEDRDGAVNKAALQNPKSGLKCLLRDSLQV